MQGPAPNSKVKREGATKTRKKAFLKMETLLSSWISDKEAKNNIWDNTLVRQRAVRAVA
jgi:hypothetical protein